MTGYSATRRSLKFVALLLLSAYLAACNSGPADNRTYSLVTVFPGTGEDASVGLAMQRAVDLAVQQNHSLGNGYTLSVTHVDEAAGSVSQDVSNVLADPHTVGIVGPLDSLTAVSVLPLVESDGVVTISPSATLPGLTQADQASAEGLSFAQLHPQGHAVAFFRVPQTDASAGKMAADLAAAPSQAHGLGAGAMFIVDDGSTSAKALSAAFAQEFKAKQGTVTGHSTVRAGVPDSAQSAVTAIIDAAPDAVFYAGDVPSGAELRSTLTLTGAPQLAILTAGPIANDPTWSNSVGTVAASAYTVGILPGQDLAILPNAKRFVADYQAAYPGQDLLPQSALAYDAAMDEIAAIKSLVAASKPITRSAVLTAVASSKYSGVTGVLAFDRNGDNTTPIGFAVYACDAKGEWRYQTSLTG